MDLAYAPIRKMEPPIVERLRLAFPAKDFSIERIPQTLTIKEFERLVKQAPFIGLAWTGMKPDPASGRILKGVMLWRLVLVFKASNGLETRFKGDRRGIGLDAMFDVAVALLQAAEIPGVGIATVTSANSVIADGWTDDNVVIAQIDFNVAFQISPAAFQLVTVDDLQRIGVSWAFGEDPDTTVATDLTELHEE
ncbi:hypothetical protein EHI47_14340 [Rhizobium leguminosarum]|uniref:DUF1834 family protein n=1 Tax=Rhizobium leguminosarum TaxID=384 RepID=A0A444I0T2_RHILE|nr:hypothetical protein [Rhizobium leguminosarum]RWX30627.1 hypothetical protein EHI47_14340 [Rhizobium leguminosarum]